MTPRLILPVLLMLSTTGCVALPLVAQVAAGGNSVAQLCSMAKIPGQTTSVCDRISSALAAQTPDKAPAAKNLNTAAR